MKRPGYAKIVIPIVAINKTTGEAIPYDCQFDASLKGFDTCHIGMCCRNHAHSHKGFFWIYKKDYNTNTHKNCLLLNSRKPRPKKPLQSSKTCTKCSIDKPLSGFHKDKNQTFGVRSVCKDCKNAKNRARRKTDVLWRLGLNLRKRLNAALKMKSWHKNTHFNSYIGCGLEELKSHLEKQFSSDMSWDNYGIFWEIDHIKPMFVCESENELYSVSHYTNLRPLSIVENRSRRKAG